ncbi:MAG: DUF937 domain-containing protein [Acetobacteraceae bacterium]|nr:DUF937 domain-containing protein [Acetobacteraceae bacterium]
MSGFLGNAIGQIGGLLLGRGQAGAAGSLLTDLVAQNGGIGGLVSRFQQAGLGDKTSSWIGSGQNLPLAFEELIRVFPPGQIDALAQRYGLPAGVVTEILSQVVPHAVDTATPTGQLPTTPGATPPIDYGALIGRLFGNKQGEPS